MREPQKRSADDTGIVAQLGNDYLCVLGGILGIYFLSDKLSEGEQQRVALIADAASDAEDIGLEDIYGIL